MFARIILGDGQDDPELAGTTRTGPKSKEISLEDEAGRGEITHAVETNEPRKIVLRLMRYYLHHHTGRV
jgi:hypothetical protein